MEKEAARSQGASGYFQPLPFGGAHGSAIIVGGGGFTGAGEHDMGGHPGGVGKVVSTPSAGVDTGRKSGSRRSEVPVAMRGAGIVDDEIPGMGGGRDIAICGGNGLVEFAADLRSVDTVGGEVTGKLGAGHVARAANDAFEDGRQASRRGADIAQ